MTYFAEQLLKLLHTYELSRRAVSAELEIPTTVFYRWAAGTTLPNVEQVEQLAVYFDVDPKYFMLYYSAECGTVVQAKRTKE